MADSTIRKGDLFFLLQPGEVQFAGYGLALTWGSKSPLVGLLMVDRPGSPLGAGSAAWLQRLEDQYGECHLYPMTRRGERGLACRMWIDAGSLRYVRPLSGSFTHQLQAALLPWLLTPPPPQLKVAWDAVTRVWRSEFIEAGPVDAPGSQPPQRRGPRFALGQVVATPGALAALEEAGQLPQEFLHRHVCGDWGALDEHDRQANERALHDSSRLLSVYTTRLGVKLYVITEWDRSVTTLLLPQEY